jgi:hypothetical protein
VENIDKDLTEIYKKRNDRLQERIEAMEEAPVGEDKTNSDKVEQLVNTSLLDKSLPEIKDLVKGKWELVSGKNNSQLCEFENTYIEFDGDNYIWIEDGKSEPGKLNWRKSDTGAGYEAFLMDAFYETNPAYPVYIKGDTLAIQDCTKTAYLYTLVKSEE